MRSINISNDKKRDAMVAFNSTKEKKEIFFVLKDRSSKKNVKILKGTVEERDEILFGKYANLKELGQDIIDNDPEIDIEKAGKIIKGTKRLYLNDGNKIAYRVKLIEIIKNPDGTEKERKELVKAASNIADEVPLRWTGKKIPKDMAVRKFVFSVKYQIKHVNGLTYDFLYNMAKTLEDSNSLMLVGAGSKGTEPIILTTGGTPYRGFLEGRTNGDKYCLMLHLTNLELKGIPV